MLYTRKIHPYWHLIEHMALLSPHLFVTSDHAMDSDFTSCLLGQCYIYPTSYNASLLGEFGKSTIVQCSLTPIGVGLSFSVISMLPADGPSLPARMPVPLAMHSSSAGQTSSPRTTSLKREHARNGPLENSTPCATSTVTRWAVSFLHQYHI